MCLPNILSTVFMSSFSPCWLLLAGRWHFPLSHRRFELSCFSTGNPGSVIVPQYGSSKITVFVWGKNIILKFLGNTK